MPKTVGLRRISAKALKDRERWDSLDQALQPEPWRNVPLRWSQLLTLACRTQDLRPFPDVIPTDRPPARSSAGVAVYTPQGRKSYAPESVAWRDDAYNAFLEKLAAIGLPMVSRRQFSKMLRRDPGIVTSTRKPEAPEHRCNRTADSSKPVSEFELAFEKRLFRYCWHALRRLAGRRGVDISPAQRHEMTHEAQSHAWLALPYALRRSETIDKAMRKAAWIASRKALRRDSYSGESVLPRRDRKDILAESVELTLASDRADHRHDGEFSIDLAATVNGVTLSVECQAIATLLSQGYTQQQIADCLRCSVGTVNNRVQLIAGFIDLQRG